jgi:hypothetical protein
MTRFSCTLWYGLNSGSIYKRHCGRTWIWSTRLFKWLSFKEYNDTWDIFVEDGYIVPLI